MARTTSELIAEKIRGRIATGQLQPGQMLPSETVLLEQYDVARSTMREALRILESDGLVTILRGTKGGAKVQDPDVASLARRVGLHLQLRGSTLEDLAQVQAAVQPRAAALAAAAADPERVAELRAAVADIGGSETVEQYLRAVDRFATALLRAAGNPVMTLFTELTAALWHHDVRAFVRDIDAAERYTQEFFVADGQRHEQFVDLIEAGDADGAEDFWRSYMEDTGVIRREGREPLRVYSEGTARRRRPS